MLLKEYIERRINQDFKLAKKIFSHNREHYSMKGSSENAYAAIITIIKILFGFNNDEIYNKELITDGKKDGGVDAIVVNKAKKQINILDVKSEGFDRQSILNGFLEELKRNFFNPNTSLHNLNPLAAKKIKEARKRFLKGNYKIYLNIIRYSDKKNAENKLKKNLESHLNNYTGVELKLLNLRDLVKVDINYSKKINFLDRIEFQDNSSFYDKKNRIVIGKVLLIKLLDMFEKADDEKYNIFEDNIRVNQNDKSLKFSFKNTILERKNKFYLFHNGITVSCKNLKQISDKYVFNVINPQIINGCQSLSTLYNMYQNKEILAGDCKKIMILTRLFEAEDENEINSVCQSTNTQRKIDKWDLRTNDFIQKTLEEILNLEGYSYQRKKKPGIKDKILITDLGQWIYSCKYMKPAKAKSSKKDLFDIIKGDKSIYKEIFNEEELKIDEITKICDYCIFVQEEIKREKKILKGVNNKNKRAFLDHANFHIMTFLYNYDKKEVQSFKKAVNFCKKAAKIIRKKEGKEYSYNNIFKNEATWKVVEKLIEK